MEAQNSKFAFSVPAPSDEWEFPFNTPQTLMKDVEVDVLQPV